MNRIHTEELQEKRDFKLLSWFIYHKCKVADHVNTCLTSEIVRVKLDEYLQRYTEKELENMSGIILLRNFLRENIQFINSKDCQRLIQFLEMNSGNYLTVCSPLEFQDLKSKFQKFSYSEPLPYSFNRNDEQDLEDNGSDDEDFEVPITPVTGQPLQNSRETAYLFSNEGPAAKTPPHSFQIPTICIESPF